MGKSTGLYAPGSLAVESYDYEQPDWAGDDMPLYLDAAASAPGPVLELGCGTGRVLIELARAGHEVTGLDTSPAMLQRCRDKVCAEPPEVGARVTIVEADMCNFDLDRRFALALFPFRSFQHLLEAGQQVDCLKTVRRHLARDGRLILDLFNPDLNYLTDEKVRRSYSALRPAILPDGGEIKSKTRILRRDWFRQTIEVEQLFELVGREDDAVTQRVCYTLRYLFRYEAEHLLHRCGFEVEKVYGDFDRKPYGDAYPGELILFARVEEDRLGHEPDAG